MELLLGQYKNKHSTNVDNYVGLEFFEESKLIHNDVITSTIDQYQQYIKEKDNSNIYRLTFTINPVCSNVLFNAISEIVYREGSSDCIFFGADKNSADFCTSGSGFQKYRKYKKLDYSSGTTLNRHDAIEDTAYSHSSIGPIVYHCGYDIFNNHTLRNKEFIMINKMVSASITSNFNTLKDYIRDRNGKSVKDTHIGINLSTTGFKSGTTLERLYTHDTFYSFSESITNNLMEKDGWLGFTNPCTIENENVASDTSGYVIHCKVNKCMNNNKSCEFIDMYPDRSLYSFIPKVNSYRNRIEPNWKYCLTYPYENYYNDIVQKEFENGNTVNGLKCHLVTDTLNSDDFESGKLITFKTDIKNNFDNGSIIGFTIIDGDSTSEILNTVSVVSVGVDGYDADYYFSVRYSNIEDYISDISNAGIELRVRRIKNGKPCQYYFRKFKRLPNFKNTNVYDDGIVTSDEIESNCLTDFNSSMNKVAFSRTIFNDNAAQIVFNDDIRTTGIRDNLGRVVSEIYLTIIKANDGYRDWYERKDYGSSGITFSHCFGKLTAGLDLMYDVDDYNVHKIHNVRVTNTDEGVSQTKKANLKDNLNIDLDSIIKNLEEENGEITVEGDSMFKNKGEFLGDIVEFSEYDLDEVVIEDVYFRFNTAQRENTDYTLTYSENNTMVAGEYANLYYDEIYKDTYDAQLDDVDDSDDNFSKTYTYNVNETYDTNGNTLTSVAYPANIFPEGYYYKAHYPIKIREYADFVSEGAHTRVGRDTTFAPVFESGKTYNKVTIKTDKNYYFQPDWTVYLYPKNRKTNKDITTTVSSVSGDNFEYITLNVPKSFGDSTILGYNIYKHNSEKPLNAYELNDGTGRYIWRGVKSEEDLTSDSELYESVFVNGAHYFHKNINFFLRRQDPKCLYGLSYCDGVGAHILNMTIDGEQKDVTTYDYVETEGEETC